MESEETLARIAREGEIERKGSTMPYDPREGTEQVKQQVENLGLLSKKEFTEIERKLVEIWGKRTDNN